MSQPQESAYSEEDVARNLSSMAIWEGVSTLPEGEAKDLTHALLDPDTDVKSRACAGGPRPLRDLRE